MLDPVRFAISFHFVVPSAASEKRLDMGPNLGELAEDKFSGSKQVAIFFESLVRNWSYGKNSIGIILGEFGSVYSVRLDLVAIGPGNAAWRDDITVKVMMRKITLESESDIGRFIAAANFVLGKFSLQLFELFTEPVDMRTRLEF